MIDPYVNYLIDCCKEKDKQIETLREALAECHAHLSTSINTTDTLLRGKFNEYEQPQEYESFYNYKQRDYRE